MLTYVSVLLFILLSAYEEDGSIITCSDLNELRVTKLLDRMDLSQNRVALCFWNTNL